ncbi:very short patch repair endonuclease [Agrobacterium tumefaciens]|nr:very short patch repair endonuclease [Agrobacterium tumefaciens]NTE22220.1 very short patch repair endonuclease [Agrobacterium tumefaciens]
MRSISKKALETDQPQYSKAMDAFTTVATSRAMAGIKAKDSRPEKILRKALWRENIRFRLHVSSLPGKPDLFLAKYKLAIFVDGDFWHGYQWEKRKEQLKSNREFWISKIERNIFRDMNVNAKLQELGVSVMRFWEHDIRKSVNGCVNQVKLYLEAMQTDGIPSND